MGRRPGSLTLTRSTSTPSAASRVANASPLKSPSSRTRTRSSTVAWAAEGGGVVVGVVLEVGVVLDAGGVDPPDPDDPRDPVWAVAIPISGAVMAPVTARAVTARRPDRCRGESPRLESPRAAVLNIFIPVVVPPLPIPLGSGGVPPGIRTLAPIPSHGAPCDRDSVRPVAGPHNTHGRTFSQENLFTIRQSLSQRSITNGQRGAWVCGRVTNSEMWPRCCDHGVHTKIALTLRSRDVLSSLKRRRPN